MKQFSNAPSVKEGRFLVMHGDRIIVNDDNGGRVQCRVFPDFGCKVTSSRGIQYTVQPNGSIVRSRAE